MLYDNRVLDERGVSLGLGHNLWSKQGKFTMAKVWGGG